MNEYLRVTKETISEYFGAQILIIIRFFTMYGKCKKIPTEDIMFI